MMHVFPFFVGSPRSGTTLLRAMFDSHPEMAVPYESYFIASLLHNRARYEAGNRFDADAFIDDIYSTAFKHWRIPEEELRPALARDTPVDYPDAVRKVFACYASREGKSRYADKTPGYIQHTGELSKLFPEARFVHIIRDGRDVALSMTQSLGWKSLEQAAIRWVASIQHGRWTLGVLGPEKYLEIRYEDLVERPESVVLDVCEFIDLSFDPGMLRYYERADQLLASEPWPDRHRNLRRPPTKGLRDWRRDMSAEDVALFESRAGHVLEQLGYDRATS